MENINDELRVVVFDLAGREIYDNSFVDNEFSIDFRLNKKNMTVMKKWRKFNDDLLRVD